MIKKILKLIWKIIKSAVIISCIIIVVAFSASTYVCIGELEDQLFELYEISAKTQNTITHDQKRKESMLLYIMRKIDISKKEILNNQNSNNKKIEKKYDGKLKIVQENIEDRFKKEQPLSYEYLEKVTVRIFSKNNIEDKKGFVGTGIIVKITEDYTYILTNKHIAPMNTHIYIIEDRKKYKVEILKNSKFQDLSLIRMNGNFSNKEAVRGFADHKIQEKVYSIGMYRGNYFIYTDGTVAGVSITKNLIVNLPSYSGCSGSGIFNSKGEVVGLLWGSYSNGQFARDTSKAICVPASSIKVFLREILNV